MFYLHDTPDYYKNFFYIFFQPSMRMNVKSINFEDKKINQSTLYKNRKLFNIHDLDVNEILVSK